jgi:hypothetical protein
MNSTPLVFRSSFFSWINPENSIFILMEMETSQARIFVNTLDIETSSEYWKLSVVIDGQQIVALGGTTADDAKILLDNYKHVLKFLQSGPESISPHLGFGEKTSEEGRALWMTIDRKGLLIVENGVQHIYEELPSGLLQEIRMAAEPEQKLILES